MPISFPTRDPETGALAMVDYWTLEEVADLFHMSYATARRRVKDGDWSVFQPIPGATYMSADHIAEAVERATHHAAPPTPDIPDGPAPRLGVPVDPTDLEGIR